MDIYAELKNYSFYENSGAFYITVKVIEKNVFQTPHTDKGKFNEVEIGESISLKTDRDQIKDAGLITQENLVDLLLSRFLIFNITGWEAAQKGYKNSFPKFIFSNVTRPCAILTEK